MSKEQLMSQEERSFQEYLGKIHGAYMSEKLSYFEHNLETWRQLWRVLEMSDIVLLITDVRHPVSIGMRLGKQEEGERFLWG
ncbi:putative G protein nucleolar 1 (putative) [Phyllostomus discolor]|nr:putative G protein nucleolar 1 (putative) [Phyllostomus discolor]